MSQSQDHSVSPARAGTSQVPLLTVEEVAAWFQCSRQAVYNWAEFGQIPCLKIGRLVRFRVADIERFLASTLQEVEAQ